MSRTGIAIGVVVVALGGLVAFFMLSKRQAAVDPISAGVGGALGAVTGGINTLFGIVGGVVSVPVRIANDAVSVVEAPFKFIAHLF